MSESKRFWVSWWTQVGGPIFVKADFDFWLGGERGDEPDIHHCMLAVIEFRNH